MTASRDRTARIWSVESKVQKAILKGHNGVVNSAAFSPNGLYAVTASSQDRTVRLWGVDSGREIAVLAGEPDALGKEPGITAATFSSDGTQVAIISGDETVQIVRVFPTPQDMIDFAHNVVRRELTDCERRRFFLPTEGEVEDCPG